MSKYDASATLIAGSSKLIKLAQAILDQSREEAFAVEISENQEEAELFAGVLRTLGCTVLFDRDRPSILMVTAPVVGGKANTARW